MQPLRMVAKLDDIFDRADGLQSWWAVIVAWLLQNWRVVFLEAKVSDGTNLHRPPRTSIVTLNFRRELLSFLKVYFLMSL